MTATERLIEAARQANISYLVQISSSVVNSAAVDAMARTPFFSYPGARALSSATALCGGFLRHHHGLHLAPYGGVYNISGLDYIDLIRMLRDTLELKRPIVRVPYPLFWTMLKACAVLDKDPPFTAKQLEALVTQDIFEIIDWPGIFGVRATPLSAAMHETYRHPDYSKIILEF
jgi:hypothetical protein